jgi:outer membrane translocation and assembly module TamA
VTGFASYRIEYDSLSDVPSAVRRSLPGVAPQNSILSGLGFGADWNATDDLLDPVRGFVLSTTIEPVGGFLAGDVTFIRAVAETRVYQPLVARLGAAARFRVGAADPLGSDEEIPLFERFYAGGINSVRGYERRRVGPLVDDDPVGGRTLVEASLELRHPITESVGGAVFLDAGQVALDSFDFPFDDLRYGTGFGVRYKSPVGPLRVDLGFPVEPPAGDPHWQVHLSLGAAF